MHAENNTPTLPELEAQRDGDADKLVLFRLGKGLFGISVSQVCELLVLTRPTSVPNTPHYVRGVINLRGQVVPVIDLRLRLGMVSLEEEMVQLYNQLELYEQQPAAWLAELEASVREQRPFQKETDPNESAFGRWYKDFSPQSIILQNHMIHFDEPHRAIHAIAPKVAKLVRDGCDEQALQLIEQTRDSALKPMAPLFEQAKALVSEECREIAVV
ncbi:MAG: chemotaxis protein CheW, partial [Myxococcota bacterium]